jgi:hypothetical protein
MFDTFGGRRAIPVLSAPMVVANNCGLQCCGSGSPQESETFSGIRIRNWAWTLTKIVKINNLIILTQQIHQSNIFFEMLLKAMDRPLKLLAL